MSETKTRRTNFERWWKKNHHNKKPHFWLVKNARRISAAFPLPADQWDQLMGITKRFFLSEHKRLSQEDAFFLWRLSYPVTTERKQLILNLSHDLDAKINTLKDLKAEAQDRTRPVQPPLQFG